MDIRPSSIRLASRPRGAAPSSTKAKAQSSPTPSRQCSEGPWTTATAVARVDRGYGELRQSSAKRGIDVDMPVPTPSCAASGQINKRRKKKGAKEKTRTAFAAQSVRRRRRTARTRIHVERKMKGLKVRAPDISLTTLAYMLGTACGGVHRTTGS
jgi:hypothetical protein